MNTETAKKIVEGIGHAYFYDDWYNYSAEQIVNQILNNIANSKLMVGLNNSKKQYNAILIVLKKFDDTELNEILRESYALWPENIGGSRVFFTNFADRLKKQIELAEAKLSGQGQKKPQEK